MQRLGIIIDAMKVYNSQYHGVEWVAKIVQGLTKQLGTLPLHESPTDWVELLVLHSDHYVQLILALDWSLRDGRCPRSGDFEQLYDRRAVSFDSVGHGFPANKGVVQDFSGCSSTALDLTPSLTDIVTPMAMIDMDEYDTSGGQIEPCEESGRLGVPNEATSEDDINLHAGLQMLPRNDATTSVSDIEADMMFLVNSWENQLLS